AASRDLDRTAAVAAVAAERVDVAEATEAAGTTAAQSRRGKRFARSTDSSRVHRRERRLRTIRAALAEPASRTAGATGARIGLTVAAATSCRRAHGADTRGGSGSITTGSRIGGRRRDLDRSGQVRRTVDDDHQR